jgi:arginine-tRNA-protein transferase
LKAVAVVDHLNDGFSAIYTFFDPADDARSLGKFVILWQIELAKQLNLPYVYLGYWVQNCRKMDYKIQYKPIELLNQGEWVRTEPS